MEEAAIAEEATAGVASHRRGPYERRQGSITLSVETGAGTDVEVARAVVLECRERGVLAKDFGNALPGESVAEAQASCDIGDDAPVLACLAWRLQERPLPGNAALGVGDRAVFLRPGKRRQADSAGVDGIASAYRLGHDR